MDAELNRFSWLKYVISLGIGGAFFSSVFYVSGKLYTAGYLSYWHLKEGSFSMPVHEVLFQSYMGLTTLVITKALPLCLALLMLFFVVFLLRQTVILVGNWKWPMKTVTWIFTKIPVLAKVGNWLFGMFQWLSRVLFLSSTADTEGKRYKDMFHVPLLVTSIGFVLFFFIFGVVLYSALLGSALNQVGFDVAKQQHNEIDNSANRSALSKSFEHGLELNSPDRIRGEYVRCFNQKCVVLNGSQVLVVSSNGKLIARSVWK